MTRMQSLATLLLACLLSISAMSTALGENNDAAPELEYFHSEIIHTFPHNNSSFTQGLEFINGELYESTGHYGNSTLRQVNLTTGESIRQVSLPNEVFAEGITGVEGKIIQLSWRNNTAFVWNQSDLTLVSNFSYSGEGWGLCFDGTQLVMSSGTSVLTFRNASTFAIERQINVTLSGQPIVFINELECHGGYIYANIWSTSRIMKINPSNGIIEANINATSLFDLQDEHANVLNGIAWDEAQQGFLLTGKNWSFSYLVNFSEGDSEYSIDSSIGPNGNTGGDGFGNDGETTDGEENWELAGQSIGFFIAITLLLLAVLLPVVWFATNK
ncbi:MAG: glutaminyl-peptide cyclotransferase [Euryarchaeota archaeon]|nr:glutaminyl-peptide cyclotransferase [Euryarchaeota archaeon]